LRARDRAIGIALGVLLGLAVIIAFLFLGSRDAIDSPDLSGGSAQPTTTAPAPKEAPGAKPQ
jgi:hypothetical protein